MFKVFFIALSFLQLSQEPDFKRYDTSQGLSNNIVYDIFHDSEGYIWIATENGLNRFNGYEFEVFKHDPSDSTSLSHSLIRTVFEDNDGNLWVGTWSGLNKFDRDTKTFKRYTNFDEGDESRIEFADIVIDPEGQFWLFVAEGLGVFDPANETYRTVALDSLHISGQGRLQVVVDNGGAIWTFFEQSDTMSRYDPSTDRFIPFGTGVIQSMYYSRNTGSIWTEKALDKSVPYSNKKRLLPLEKDVDVQKLIEDQYGNLWMGTDKGIYLQDAIDGSLKHYSFKGLSPGSLGYFVQQVYEDRNGGVWVASRNGLYHYDLWQKPFGHIQLPEESSSSIVMAMKETEAGIFIGTLGGGIYLYNIKGESFSKYEVERNAQNAPAANDVWDIFQHSKQTDLLWLATGNGLYRLDINNRFYKRIELPFSTGSSELLFSIIEGSESSIWIAGDEDIYHFDVWKNSLIKQVSLRDHAMSLSTVQALHIYHEKLLLVGTQGAGLLAYDLEGDAFVSLAEGNKTLLEDQPIWDIRENKKGDIWLATGKGLVKFDPVVVRVDYIDAPGDLSSSIFYSVEEDREGKLWLGTESGLATYSSEEGIFEYYDTDDGIINNEFNRRASLQLQDGRFLFGGIQGITSFFPTEIKKVPFSPPTHITSVHMFDEEGEHEILFSDKETLNLSWRDNTFEIAFTALDYSNPENVKYRYRLENADPTWIEGTERRFARYTKLSPGEYVFQVQAANSDGVWNETGDQLAIVINPPFWSTWWAYAGYILIGIVGILGFIRYRTHALEVERKKLEEKVGERTSALEEQKELAVTAKKKIEVQAGQLQELDELKSRFFANISHELRTPLTLIDVPVRELLEKWNQEYEPETLRKKLELIERNSSRLRVLIEELLDLTRLKQRTLKANPKPVHIRRWMNLFIDSYQSMAESKGLVFNTESSISGSKYVAFDLDHFEKITANLVGNALKFTPAGGAITVGITITENRLTFKVGDTGPGIPEEDISQVFERFYQSKHTANIFAEGMGLGLALSNELAQVMGGELNVRSKVNEGSTFTLVIPVYPADAEQEADNYSGDVPNTKEPTSHTPKTAHEASLLIVEDNDDMRIYLQELLEPHFDIYTSSNGVEAFEKLKVVQPNLIISDWMMPEMDGIEFLERMRAIPNYAHIPVLMLTARASNEDKLQGLQLGVDDYLIKPFIHEELKARVQNLVDNHLRKLKWVSSNEGTRHKDELDEEKTLAHIQKLVEKQLDNTELNVHLIADLIHSSERQVYRKIKGLTGMTPIEYINSIRLGNARTLLQSDQHYTIDVIAEKVGFKSRAYFSRLFKKAYGVTPGKFQSLHNAPIHKS